MPMKEVLGSRGLNLDPMCELCCEGAESIIHTFSDYKVARAAWRDLGFEENDRVFFLFEFGRVVEEVLWDFH